MRLDKLTHSTSLYFDKLNIPPSSEQSPSTELGMVRGMKDGEQAEPRVEGFILSKPNHESKGSVSTLPPSGPSPSRNGSSGRGRTEVPVRKVLGTEVGIVEGFILSERLVVSDVEPSESKG